MEVVTEVKSAEVAGAVQMKVIEKEQMTRVFVSIFVKTRLHGTHKQ